MNKKLLKFLCTALMAMVCMSVNATVYNGNCGNSPDGNPATNAITWSFDTETGVITLTGTGAVKTFSNAGPIPYPWCDYDGSGNNKGMEDITTIVIGEGITNVPDYAFAMYEYCTSVSLPSTLTIIGNSALEECAFNSIDLPEGLEVIDDYAFLGSKFSSITLPSTLTTIGSSAFNDCESLSSITIPANVTSIGESAFQNCIALQTVTILRATPPTLGDLAFYNYGTPAIIIPALTAINVPAANVANYKAAANWSDYAALIVAATTTFTYTASEKETAFDTYANFTGATGVKSHEFADGAGTVVYEGTVTAIADAMMGTSYYSKNTSLTGVVIPSGVKIVGMGAFSYCSNLVSVTLPADLVTLDQGSFAYTKIASITIPNHVKNINAAAFMGCTKLTSIDIPNSVTFLGNNIFLGCSLLSSATLGSGITAISRKLFDNCVMLESIVIPDGVTIIGAEAFMGCSGLKTVTIGSGVTEIEDGSTNGYDEAFRDCNSVTDVYCYANPATLTWDKNSNTTIFKSSKATQFHVANADAWNTKFPSANVTFVEDLTNVTLSDETNIGLVLAGRSGKECTITYSRSFTDGKSSTVCLPFAYAKAGAAGTFYSFTGITKSGSNYIADMTEYTNPTLVPNAPYLFMPSATGSVNFSGTYTLPASITAGSTTSGDWIYLGTYETVSWTSAPTGIYGFSAQDVGAQGISQGQFVKVGAYVKVKPMRCYLKYKNATEDYAGAPRRTAEELPNYISVRLIDASGNITAIGTLSTTTGEVIFDDSWYTLEGIRLSSKPAQPGIYVNNGKKYIIK